jgi:transcriptional regulator with XRE-family HTH domain
MTNSGDDLARWEDTFVVNMINERQRLGMSQTQLARRIAEEGVPCHQQTVQRIEQGARSLRLNEAQAVTRVLFMGEWQRAIQPVDADAIGQLLADDASFLADFLARFGSETRYFLDRGGDICLSLALDQDRYRSASVVQGTEVDDALLRRVSDLIDMWNRFEEQIAGVMLMLDAGSDNASSSDGSGGTRQSDGPSTPRLEVGAEDA